MRKLLTVLPLAAVALALAPGAAAKGPDRATVTGPGLDTALVVRGAEAPGTPLMTLAESFGFFPAVFNQSPDPMLKQQPKVKLGPKYLVTYRVPGPNGSDSTIRQAVYPYAKPYPVSYTKPGQPFWDGQRTHGGWYEGNYRAKETLVAAGLPKTPPVGGGGGPDVLPWIGGAALVLALLLGLALAARLVARRRPGLAT